MDNWDCNTFFNDSILTAWGPEVKKDFNSREKALQRTIKFMNAYTALLDDFGIPLENISAIATAFRRIETNLDEILSKIQKRTNITIAIINNRSEALLSLAAVAMTYRFGKRGEHNQKFSTDDVFILLDQGGSSMKVSYLGIGEDMSKGKVASFIGLGTIVLQNDFFRLNAEGRHIRYINPEYNPNAISTQYKSIRTKIWKRVEEWGGYPELRGKTLHAYGIGSAITNPVRGSSWQIHNKILSVENIENFIEKNYAEIENYKQVCHLYGEHKRIEQEQDKEIYNRKLLMLYGLPVYKSLLKKFGLKYLRLCGYGLRYGLYVWKYHLNEAFLP